LLWLEIAKLRDKIPENCSINFKPHNTAIYIVSQELFLRDGTPWQILVISHKKMVISLGRLSPISIARSLSLSPTQDKSGPPEGPPEWLLIPLITANKDSLF
jgi:hypothetical protein